MTCRYPNVKGVTGYQYGCRCARCEAGRRDTRRAQEATPKGRASKHRAGTKWQQANPDKVKAHNLLNRAVARGDLVRPESCEHCGKQAHIEASHTDYAEPLEVEWLCRLCHRQKDGIGARLR